MGVRAMRAAELFGWDDEAESIQAKARAASDDEVARIEQRFVTFPCGNFEKLVRSDDEVEVVFGMIAAEAADGIYAVKDMARAFEGGFGDGWDVVRVIRAGERNHGVAMQKRREIALGFVRGARRSDEINRVEVKTAKGCLGNGHMSSVDWIERAAEHSNGAVMGVGLMGGQRSSR